jgi:hypothetical protein
MTIGEHIKQLVNAPDYNIVRMFIGDSFIEFLKENMPSSYDLIKEKEEAYQKLLNDKEAKMTKVKNYPS